MSDEQRLEELAKSVYYGRFNTVMKMLSSWPDIPINKKFHENHSQTLLHVACAQGHMRIAAALIENGAAVSVSDEMGNTPLHLAALNKCKEVAALLRVSGADVEAHNVDDMRPEDLITDKSFYEEFKGTEYIRKNSASKPDDESQFQQLREEVTLFITKPGARGIRKTFNVPLDYIVEDLKALIEVSLGVPVHEQQLIHERTGIILENNVVLKDIDAKEGDNFILNEVDKRRRTQEIPWMQDLSKYMAPALIIPGSNLRFDSSGAEIVQFYMNAGNDSLLQLERHFPDVADAIRAGDANRVDDAWEAARQKMQLMVLDHAITASEVSANPDSKDAQEIIMEQIRQQNVGRDLAEAMEVLPEAMTQIHMLLIRVAINDTMLIGLVDTGAQSTIMTKSVAERCGLLNRLDQRMKGVIQGVGKANILGRVHLTYFQFGDFEIPCSIIVIEDGQMQSLHGADFIFGLDMMRRHECEIHLRRDKLSLVFGGSFEVHFLPEIEIEEIMRKNAEQQGDT